MNIFLQEVENKKVNSVLSSEKLVSTIYNKLNLRLAREECYSQSLLECHFFVTLVSLAIHQNFV